MSRDDAEPISGGTFLCRAYHVSPLPHPARGSAHGVIPPPPMRLYEQGDRFHPLSLAIGRDREISHCDKQQQPLERGCDDVTRD